MTKSLSGQIGKFTASSTRYRRVGQLVREQENELNRLRLENARLEVELENRRQRIERSLGQHRALLKEKQKLEQEPEEIFKSESWKLTAPLRKLGLVKKLFPLIRFRSHKLALTALDYENFEKSIVKSYALSSIREYFPSGWVWIRGSFNDLTNSVLYTLFFDDGNGFSDERRLMLTFADENHGKLLVRFPKYEIKAVWKRFKYILINPKAFYEQLRRFIKILKGGGLTALKAKLLADEKLNFYQEWIHKYDLLSDQDRAAIREKIAGFLSRPLISVVLPVYNTPEKFLRAAIESVRNQLYENWELCIADDHSPKPHVRKVLEEYRAKDDRIKVVYRKENGHISVASNSAIELATGEFLALLDHDDELSEHALYFVVNEINEHPDAALIYSDEDNLTEFGMRFNPFFKPNWNPELLYGQNCVCHLGVYRADLVRKIGGFRKGFEGAQDWDLVLRFIEQISEAQIRHIPQILYHWRVIRGSTAHSATAKPYALRAGCEAIEDHFERTRTRAKVEILEDIANYRIIYALPQTQPLVSLIIPTRDKAEFLQRCVTSIRDKTNYKIYELVIVDNDSVEARTLDYLEELEQEPNVTIVRDKAPFNFARLNNQAAQHAKGELLGFLNNDLEVINSNWLREMVSICCQEGVGGVGARLWYPNNLLQHGGVILGIGGVAGHSHKGRPRYDPGYFNRASLVGCFSAITAACLLMPRRVFDEIKGFDEQALAIAFNDIDLCLRIREQGYRIVWTPYAELYHHESASRGYENTKEKFQRFEKEIKVMQGRWGALLQNDPYYNPNLTLESEDYALAFPPRAQKPWKVKSLRFESAA
ncbi:MAG: glycosyltransferase [Acidobacteriota bacterium]